MRLLILQLDCANASWAHTGRQRPRSGATLIAWRRAVLADVICHLT